MTREEEIIKQGIFYTSQICPACISGDDPFNWDVRDLNRDKAFEDGAKWADAHPINVWHTINEQPKIDEDVVLYDSCGNFVTEFYNGDVTWNNIVVFHKATMWAYVADVLPKGGENEND